MSYGNRGFIFTAVFGLVVIAFGAGWWLDLPPKGHVPRESNEQYQLIERARAEASLTLKQGGDPSKYNPPCQEGEEDRQSELCAQWSAADAGQSASRWAGRSFIAGLLLGTLTLIAAGFAAIYARLAAIHTEAGALQSRRAADAAERNLEQTRETSEAQLRAYIRSDMESFIRDPEDPAHFNFIFPFKNVGQTSARNVYFYSTVVFDFFKKKIGPLTIASKPYKTEFINRGPVSFGTLARGGDMVVYDEVNLNEDQITQLEQNQGMVRFDCSISYTDIYDVDWVYSHVFYFDLHAMEHGRVHTRSCDTRRVHDTAEQEKNEEATQA